MRVRIALKIFKAVGEYSGWERFDMPYTGKQIYAAAKQRAEHLKQQLEGTGYALSSPEDKRKERILIASFAMQGMIANDRFYDALLDKGNHAKALAVTSLKFADALLAEVDKEKGGSDD